MTFFAKWRISNPAEIWTGMCPRSDLPLQAEPGEKVVAMSGFAKPNEVQVEAGQLRRKSDGAALEVPYLDDELLADLIYAVRSQADSAETMDAAQRLKAAQTIEQAEAFIRGNGLVVTQDDLARARRDRTQGRN